MLKIVLNFLYNRSIKVCTNFYRQILQRSYNIKDFAKFPKSCIICGKLNINYVCNKCEERFEKYKKFNIIDNKKLFIDKLGIQNINLIQKFYLIYNQKIYWEKMIYCFEYKGIVRKCMLQYKFFDKAYLSNFFSYQVLKNKKIYEMLKTYDIIIPVPMDKIKRAKRGYNQTELITNIISKSGIIETNNNILDKIKLTETQSTLKKYDRKNNVKNSYIVKLPNEVKNRNIVLFDDIYTTGATVNEISQKLKEAGAKEILVIVIAKD